MKTTSILLLSLAVWLPGLACAEPASQTEAAGTPTEATDAEPAELLRNGKAPLDGHLTGGQPTAEQFETLAGLGYKTIINLRGVDENGSTDPALVESLGMTYVSIPISGADVGEENAHKLAEVLENAEYPVVTHCASGNRVGALYALKAFYVDGMSPEEALALGQAAGVTRLEPVIRQQLGLE